MLKSSPILAAAASPAFLAKGCVNVVEFDGLKEAADARWARIREGVYTRLETLLRAKLGPNDLFVRLGETAYLVTMPTTEAEDVSAVCLSVAVELHTSFLGLCDLSQIHVSTVINSDEDALVLNRLTSENVLQLAERAGITDAISIRGVPAEQSLQFSSSGTSGSLVEAGGRLGAMRPSTAPPPALSPRVEHHFIPIWSVPNAAVTTYACDPKSIFVAGRPDNVPLAQLASKERSFVEMSVLQAGIRQLEKSYAAGNRFLLCIPLSFDVLGTPVSRIQIMSICRELSHSFRPLLVFMIYDVPPGVAQTRLANMVNTLRPFGRNVVATISPTNRTYGSYVGIGLRSVGFDLREFSALAPFCQNDAEQLSQFARRSNLGTFLWGVHDKAELKYAQDANIQNLSGPAVIPPCSEPSGMLRLNWGQILAQPVVELWV